MPPTRPQASTPEDLTRWAAELEAFHERLEADESFRGDMREFAGRTDATLSGLTKEMAAHAREDRRRFRQLERKVGSVTQIAGETSSSYKVLWAVGGIIAGVIAVAATIWGLRQ